jgi:hypothetical protein
MNKQDWIYVIIAMVVVSVIVSFASLKMTGNVVKVPTSIATSQIDVYTTAEVNSKVDSIWNLTVLNLKDKCSMIPFTKNNDSYFEGCDTACGRMGLGRKGLFGFLLSALGNSRITEPISSGIVEANLTNTFSISCYCCRRA